MRNPIKAVSQMIVDGGKGVVAGKIHPQAFHSFVSELTKGMHIDTKKKVIGELDSLGFQKNPEAEIDSAAEFLKRNIKQ